MAIEKNIIEIISLDENTPDYVGASELIRFGGRFFRTQDAEGYASWLNEISKEKFEELKKFKSKDK